MINRLLKYLRTIYNKTIHSIAFYPALIAVAFLLLSWLMLELDFSEGGKHIKASYSLIRLKDASTARTMVSTIAGGIISLMVFSFSMVMILLNQAASQMSNRMLESMIGNRFQQMVLGFYIGTIVYSLFLLSTIRDIESGIYVPALSIYLLLLITVADIFMFIYFLHYVTQSVKFETIIDRVYEQTISSLKKACTTDTTAIAYIPSATGQIICTRYSGYYQGFDIKLLASLAEKLNGAIKLLHPVGTFLLKDQPVAAFYGKHQPKDKDIEDLLLAMDFYPGQPVEQNYYYGFHQLTEVALKALSPGINDPETAVLSIHALADLFAHRLKHYPKSFINSDKGSVLIYLTERSFKELFEECIYPVWDYGSDDRFIQNALQAMISQLMTAGPDSDAAKVLNKLQKKIIDKITKRNTNEN